MRTTIIILVSMIVLVTLALLMLFGSMAIPETGNVNKMTRRAATYSNKDKDPLGSYVPFNLMEHFFKDVKPETITRSFSRTFRNNKELKAGGNIYFIVAGQLFTTQQDVQAMKEYLSIGNRLFVAVEDTDSLFDAAFDFTEMRPSGFFSDSSRDQAVQIFVNNTFAPDTIFHSKGLRMTHYLGLSDAERTTILGNNEDGKPNFFRLKVGKGYLFVLLNSMVWTNYFLLQENNIKAMEAQMAYLPQYPQRIYWDEYYKTLNVRENDNFSSWQVLLKHPALRWALWIAVLLLLLYVLFEGKRRQRMIPEKPALANASLDFVETLGRLYYLHNNNSNLAQKMSQYLLEHIRTNYNLNTSQLDEHFVTALARKSGHPQEDVTALIAQLKFMRNAEDVDDDQLQHYYNSIHQFYLKAS